MLLYFDVSQNISPIIYFFLNRIKISGWFKFSDVRKFLFVKRISHKFQKTQTNKEETFVIFLTFLKTLPCRGFFGRLHFFLTFSCL